MANDQKNMPKKKNQFMAKRLTELIDEHDDIGIKGIAELIGVGYHQVENYKRGVNAINPDCRKTLIETFNLEPDYFEEPKTEAEKYNEQLRQMVKGYDAKSTIATIQLLRVIDPDFISRFPCFNPEYMKAQREAQEARSNELKARIKELKKREDPKSQEELRKQEEQLEALEEIKQPIKLSSRVALGKAPDVCTVKAFKSLIADLWTNIENDLQLACVECGSGENNFDFGMACHFNKESKRFETTFYRKDTSNSHDQTEPIETVTVPKEEPQKHKEEETNSHPVSEEVKDKDTEQ